MRMVRYFTLLLLLLSLVCTGKAQAGQADSSYQSARADYYQLKNSSRKQLYRENWMAVIKTLEQVQQRYPESRHAADALYLAAKAGQGLYDVSRVGADARLACDLYLRLAERYPQDNLADDGLILAADLYEKVLKEPETAYRYYLKVVNWYPDGDMFGKAQDKVGRLARYAQKSAPPERARNSGPVSRALTDIRHWSDKNYTRVVFDFSDKVVYRVHYLKADAVAKDPARIYFDIDNLTLGQTVLPEITDRIIGGLRSGEPKTGVTRLVLDLKSDAEYKVFELDDPYRIVVDMTGPALIGEVDSPTEIRSMPPAADQIASLLEKTPKEAPPRIQIPNRNIAAGLRKIVVDAGHGGKDPGAIGPNRVKEKDVTLAIAKQLAKRLRSELGCEVIMTRSDDTFLPLHERTAMANRLDADLFISIHANASTNRRAYGVETYYLNFSKNDQAVAVAARENGTTLKEVGDLELILFDLMANSKINESSRLAAEIQNSLIDRLSRKYSKVKDLGVRPGPFHVLLGATMPSVLVETAFISNKREEQRLTDDAYHRQTADAIIAGVRNYAKAFKLIAAK